MKERLTAGKSHPLVYLPVSEVPLFPSHTPCLLFNQRRERMHAPCSHHQWHSLLFFLPFLKINPLSGKRHFLLFNHSLTGSFNTTAIYWVLLGSGLGTQTRRDHSAHPSGTNNLGQPTHKPTIVTVPDECCREEGSE